jgi:Flp pilus assembly pilin Flp
MLALLVRLQLTLFVRLRLAFARLIAARDGQESVEYAMVLFFILFIILVATRFLSTRLSSVLNTIANSI